MALAPRGAVVKSPDRIKDNLTGRLREVDASIKIKIGSVPILITVECRKRSTIQNDTWIEQLATKKEKIGAAKIIAVSSFGFSEPARITAKSKGIELRTIKEANNEDIVSWIKNVILVHKILRVKLKSISAEVDQDTPSIYRFEPNGFIKALVRVEDNSYLSPYKVLELIMQEKSTDLFAVGPDGDKKLIILSTQLPKRTLQVQSPKGNQFITTINYEFERCYETKNEILANGNHYKYMENEIIHAQGVEFKTEIEGIPVIVSLVISGLNK